MAAGVEASGGAAVAASVVQSSPHPETANGNGSTVTNAESVVAESKGSGSKSEIQMRDIVEMLSKLKLNPLAKEFFPSYLHDPNRDQLAADNFSPAYKYWGSDEFPSYRRRRNSYALGRRRFNGRATRAQREESIRRTVYVSEIDYNVTEEQLATLFGSKCGQAPQELGENNSQVQYTVTEVWSGYLAE